MSVILAKWRYAWLHQDHGVLFAFNKSPTKLKSSQPSSNRAQHSSIYTFRPFSHSHYLTITMNAQIRPASNNRAKPRSILLVSREIPMRFHRPLTAMRTDETVIGGTFAQGPRKAKDNHDQDGESCAYWTANKHHARNKTQASYQYQHNGGNSQTPEFLEISLHFALPFVSRFLYGLWHLQVVITSVDYHPEWQFTAKRGDNLLQGSDAHITAALALGIGWLTHTETLCN